jgi:two-component system, sensor histidine kinase and response regulator
MTTTAAEGDFRRKDESGSTGDPGRILVVDDTAANVRLLSGILQIAGYTVETAGNGPDALPVCERNPPDVVLLDVMMPDMDGFEVCRRIKATDPFLPVVMVTALQDTADRVRALEAGADDFLTKPVDEVEVLARVRTLVRARRQHRELETAYFDLRRAESLRDSLSAMLVHDLRTPLTGIIGPLETLIADPAAPLSAIQKEMLNICRNSSYQLLGMVNDLLDVNKMEAGEIALERAELLPEEAAGEALALVQTLADQKDIRVERDIAPDLPRLNADRDLLRRILVNLLGNALKFTPRDGTVTLSLHREEQESGEPSVVFTVRDTGEGIPRESFTRIFEKFGQVESRKEGRKMSTGLGLTFCKMAVEAHGGHIWVESELGQGSAFFVSLPAESPAADRL